MGRTGHDESAGRSDGTGDAARGSDRAPHDADGRGGAGAAAAGRGTGLFDSMLLARRIRIVVLAAFVLFVAWRQMWLLAIIGVGLMLLTLWQTARLKEEIAVRLADDAARGGHGD